MEIGIVEYLERRLSRGRRLLWRYAGIHLVAYCLLNLALQLIKEGVLRVQIHRVKQRMCHHGKHNGTAKLPTSRRAKTSLFTDSLHRHL